MGSKLQVEGDESVLLRVTHSNIKSFATDVRFSLQVSALYKSISLGAGGYLYASANAEC